MTETRNPAIVEEAQQDHERSPGIPAPRRPGEPDTGDTFTATSEGGTTAGPGFGSVVQPPGEGGTLTGPTEHPVQQRQIRERESGQDPEQ